MDRVSSSISSVQHRDRVALLALLAAVVLAAPLLRWARPREAPIAWPARPLAHSFEPTSSSAPDDLAPAAAQPSARARARRGARRRGPRPRSTIHPARTRPGRTILRAALALLRAHLMIRPKVALGRAIFVRAHESAISVERVPRADFEKAARDLFYTDADIAGAHALVVVFASFVHEPGARTTRLGAVLGAALSSIGRA